jgi:hypothetical protein
MSRRQGSLRAVLTPTPSFLPHPRLPPAAYSCASPQQIQFKEKILWTGVTLFIFLVCCQVGPVASPLHPSPLPAVFTQHEQPAPLLRTSASVPLPLL